MEHTLGVSTKLSEYLKKYCLNPCFSGTYSRRVDAPEVDTDAEGLNPCFSGTYSRSVAKATEVANKVGLNPCFSGTYSRRIMSHSLSMLRMVVLILVLVEHTLGVLSRSLMVKSSRS